jgi:hypothetical protein
VSIRPELIIDQSIEDMPVIKRTGPACGVRITEGQRRQE